MQLRIRTATDQFRSSIVQQARLLFQAGGLTLILLACLSGVVAGIVVTGLSRLAGLMHERFFSLPLDVRLSGLLELSRPSDALVPVAGGIVMGISILLLRKFRNRAMVDPIEANALYGGRISLTDSLIVTAQTIVSNGFGASVGLEAAYTQMGSGLSSRIGRFFGIRRNDVRTLVGCGAAGAIAAAFGAPLTGAFYGFELIIGVYSLANVAPVMAAAVSASLTATWLGAEQFPIAIGAIPQLAAGQYIPFLLLGLIAGLGSVGIMRLVATVERVFAAARVHPALRPVVGGAAIGLLGLVSPQVLSGGHGAMQMFLSNHFALATVATVFLLKLAASALSLGTGFRGGLFFASLFLGALLGNMFATVANAALPFLGIHTTMAAVVGMTSLAVGIVGGPLTMTFLALEATRDLAITGVVLAASIVSSLVVRSIFGYSFSTWRFHLRGETIRSAHDVGWMRNLTVRSMMRTDARTVHVNTTVPAFRTLFPLGSAQRVVAIDDEGRYEGMIFVPEAYADEPSAPSEPDTVRRLLRFPDTVLVPPLNAKGAAEIFEKAKAEELPVVDGLKTRKVVGLLTEGHLMRRYSEELEKVRRDLSGEI
ncbi:MAG: chloride channel protein [Methylobacterium mesophilicum]|nr:chloride channel protein [Methylobacterium mesophilicum]